jgi:putative nucleotidyltransferase with HDIG domain
LVFAGIVLLVPTGAVFWRRGRFGRDPVQFALAAAAWYSAVALASLKFGRLWHLSWWDYHIYLLAGFGAATWAVAREARRTGDTVATMSRLTVSDPVEQIALGYTESLRPLVAAVEARDYCTHGHSERVSTLAANVALRMRLSPESVRAVAEGAYLHDIGKIAVPDAVLNKTGPLTMDERQLVEGHPVAGWEIARRAPSLRHTLKTVRHHHERWDGSGYPDALAATDIPLAARVVAVADVWDALTSDRAYRAAWTEAQAITYLRDERGRHFDPDCLDALLALLTDQGVRTSPPDQASWRPLEADACHHRTTPEKSASRG